MKGTSRLNFTLSFDRVATRFFGVALVNRANSEDVPGKMRHRNFRSNGTARAANWQERQKTIVHDQGKGRGVAIGVCL